MKSTLLDSSCLDKSSRARLVKLIENKNNKIQILSGEGDYGSFKLYTGKRTMRAIKIRLTKERCGGDRWARALVYSYSNDHYDIYYNLETGDVKALLRKD